jgi:hypothetical protein
LRTGLWSECLRVKLNLRNKMQAGFWWLTPVILAIWKAEVGRIEV